MNDYQKSMLAKYRFTSYSSHFSGAFVFLQIISIIALAVSCLAVAKYIEAYMDFFGEAAFLCAFAVACFLGIGIHYLTNKMLVYHSEQGMIEPMLATLVGGGIMLTIIADFQGSPKWAYNIVGEAPADAKTGELGGIYTPQIEAINAEIADIEGKNFYWCATHNSAHKCSSAQYYVDPKGDKKHVAKIEQLKAQRSELQSTMNGLLSDAGAQHKAKLGEYESELSERKSSLKFGSIFCTAIFLIATKWSHNYGTRYVKEIETPNTAENKSYTPNTAQGKRVKAVLRSKQSRVSRVQATQQPFSRAQNLATSVNEREEELARENMALKEEVARNEERIALQEMEESKRLNAKKP